MSKHVAISPQEAADRLAIRELIEAYAHCADRRDAKGQMALFTTDTHFVVYMNAKDPKPSQELHSRDALAPVFATASSAFRGPPPSTSATRSRMTPVAADAATPSASDAASLTPSAPVWATLTTAFWALANTLFLAMYDVPYQCNPTRSRLHLL
jgi:hypothetical protein